MAVKGQKSGMGGCLKPANEDDQVRMDAGAPGLIRSCNSSRIDNE